MVLLDPQGRRGEMHAGILPAPFHMTGSFLTFSPLALKDKLCIARAFYSILQSGGHPPDVDEPGGISMLEWLRRRKQTPAAISRFWRVVLVSALSEELDRIDARYGIDVFWKAVLSNKTGYRMGVPTVALGDLYEGCRAAIEQKGGEVIFRSPLRGLRIENGKLLAALFDDGREESADAYVLALPHAALSELLPEGLKRTDTALGNLDKIIDASITGVHLWFDRQVMTEPFLSFAGHHHTMDLQQDGSLRRHKWRSLRNRQRPISATRHQRLPRSPPNAAPGNHRSLPEGGPPRASRRPRSEPPQSHRYQRSRRHIFPATRRRPLASNAADKHRRFVPRRRLDRNRLARHHGRRSSQRLSCSRSDIAQ